MILGLPKSMAMMELLCNRSQVMMLTHKTPERKNYCNIWLGRRGSQDRLNCRKLWRPLIEYNTLAGGKPRKLLLNMCKQQNWENIILRTVTPIKCPINPFLDPESINEEIARFLGSRTLQHHDKHRV